MTDLSHKALDQRDRLERIRTHLELRTPVGSRTFEGDAAAACAEKVQDLLEESGAQCGEQVLDHVARQLQVHFEEVHNDGDIAGIEQKYLEKKEIGFGQLSIQLDDPSVDALLFERERASADAPDKWVAVLNLRETTRRGYWSRTHELIHRIAEPPQFRLPFYRHRTDSTNPLESLIDKAAAHLAYYPPLFEPIVAAYADEPLTWELIERIRARYAPTSSTLATVHAVLRHWKRPATLLMAQVGGRRGRPNVNRALRIVVQGFSLADEPRLFFIPNMRVPSSSPVAHCFESGEEISAYEDLGRWVTSDGGGLPAVRALTSVFRWSEHARVYALISPE